MNIIWTIVLWIVLSILFFVSIFMYFSYRVVSWLPSLSGILLDEPTAIANMLKRFSSKDAICHKKNKDMCVEYGVPSNPFTSCEELTDYLNECSTRLTEYLDNSEDKQNAKNKLLEKIKTIDDEALKDVKTMEDVEVWIRTRVESIYDALYCVRSTDNPDVKVSVREALSKMTELFNTLLSGNVTTCDDFKNISTEVKDVYPKNTHRSTTRKMFENHLKEYSKELVMEEEIPHPMEDHGIDNYMFLQERKYC